MLAKFSPILDGIREKNPGFLTKTAELVSRFSAAAQRYEAVLKNVEARRNSLPARQEAHGQFLPAEALTECPCRISARRSKIKVVRDPQFPWRFP
jgi:hypothetical protein